MFDSFLAVLFFFSLAFFLLSIYKLIKEITLNKKLKEKHLAMRVYKKSDMYNYRYRRFGLVTIAPILMLVAVLTFSLGLKTNAYPYDTHDFGTNKVANINSKSDLMNIFDSFNEKYSTYGSNFNKSLDSDSLNGAEDEAILDNSYGSDDSAVEKSSGSNDYSKTNTQVDGVDEMDTVKTDGKYIYALDENKVVIANAYPANELSIYKTLEYEEDVCSTHHFYPNGIYVDEDYLVVIGYESLNYYYYDYEYKIDEEGNDVTTNDCKNSEINNYFYYYRSKNTKVYVYDKNNNFELVTNYNLDGNYVGTRKIENDEGNFLYIITNKYIYFNKAEEYETNLDEILTTYSVDDKDFRIDYEDIIYFDGTRPDLFTNVFGIDLEEEEIDVETLLGSNSYNMYVSKDNIYITDYLYYFDLFILNIDGSRVLENVEEKQEISTIITKIAINGKNVDAVSSGKVFGTPLNQFSMDEYNDYFRIATTSGWGADANNRLYILNDDLEVESFLEDLGKPNERLQSSRFLGDKVYLVTFEQTDPFYVIDTSNPKKPTVMGELEVSGFSSYLHPIDDNHILGIGFEVENNQTVGLKLSIYDVSDEENPTDLYNEIISYEDIGGWGGSSATYNHKDLLFDSEKGLIAFPFSYYDYDFHKHRTGYLVYNFNLEEGFSEKQYVSPTKGEDEEVYVSKGLFIDDFLYVVSTKGIYVSHLEDVENILYTLEYN